MNKGNGHMQPEVSRFAFGAARQTGITLVELLVVMVILGIVTTMILGTWFALQSSFAYSSHASSARESARDSLTRMTREVRDAQGYGGANPITRADRFLIVFYSTFNQANNSRTGTPPVQTAFVYLQSTSGKGGKIYRVLDKNANGVADEVGDPVDPAAVASNGSVIVDNVVNWWEPSVTTQTSLFRYTYFADDTTFKTVDSMTGVASTARILSVQIRVLVDLNPNRAPVYMDLQTTAQPRNGRPSS